MKAIVLFSGGLDSTVALAYACKLKRDCLAVSFHYGQRHTQELLAAKAIAAKLGVEHKIFSLNPQAFQNSSLVSEMSVPKNRSFEEMSQGSIPNTYVPARNTIFLAYAMGQAEVSGAKEIYIAANAMDHNGYPDCRPTFFERFQTLMNVATTQASPQIITPFIHSSKAQIIHQGIAYKAPLELSHSCYDPSPKGLHCGTCDACLLRQQGFLEAQVQDPTTYSTCQAAHAK